MHICTLWSLFWLETYIGRHLAYEVGDKEEQDYDRVLARREIEFVLHASCLCITGPRLLAQNMITFGELDLPNVGSVKIAE